MTVHGIGRKGIVRFPRYAAAHTRSSICVCMSQAVDPGTDDVDQEQNGQKDRDAVDLRSRVSSLGFVVVSLVSQVLRCRKS